MQIRCERCSTSYVLDDALIPPQGAPVQCTRCGLVFTAKPEAAPAPAASAAPASSTQVFGAVKPPVDPAKANTTLVFGSGAAKPSSTQVFGAVPGASSSSTLTFGSPGPAGSTTAMFGAVAPESPKPVGTTLPFGGGSKPAGSTTAMFGAVAPESPKPAANTTRVFGALANPAAVPNRGSTAMFGALTPEAPKAAGNTTLVFGGAAGSARDPRTAPDRGSTAMFGALDAPPSPARSTSPAPVPDAQTAAKPKPVGSATLMFGGLAGPAGAPPAANATITAEVHTSQSGALAEPAGARASPAAWQAPPPAADFSPQAEAVTEPPGLSASTPPRRPTAPASFPALRATDVGDEALARQLEGRGRRVGLTVALLVLLVGGGLAANRYVHRPHPPPPELVTRVLEASRGLELDTPGALDSSLKQLQALVPASPPNYPAAQANALVVMAFQEADLRAQSSALQAEFTRLQKEHTRADADHARADWRLVVNGLVDQMKDVKAQLDPVQARAAALDQAQGGLLHALSAARAKIDRPVPELDRAFGIYYAFKGGEQAARFAQSYRAQVASDGWADLIAAAAADQPRQTEDTLKAGLAAAQAAVRANPRLTRARRVAADLLLALHDFAGARAQATELSLLSPDDPRVKLLLANIDAAEKAARPPQPDPAPAP